MKYPVRNRKIKHSKLIAFWASVLAVASVSSIGFAAWVLPSENTSQDVGNVDIEVGDINKYNWLTLDKVESFIIHQNGIMNSENDALFTNSPQISLYLTTDGNFTAGKRINIYGITATGLSSYFENPTYTVGYAIVASAGSTILGYTPITKDLDGNFTTVDASTTLIPVFKFKITITFSIKSGISYSTLYNETNKQINVNYQASIIEEA